MKDSLPETKYIFEMLLNEEQKSIIQAFLDDVHSNGDKYESKALWVLDQKVGGIGGYSMPPDPNLNPYPVGINRTLFRPLQYVRCEIEICDIRMHPRFIIHYSGMHLEAVLRLYLKSVKTLGNLRFFNSRLNKHPCKWQ